ncbi:MAG TPA: diphthamide synthesis protein [Candidatus Nanoarchaeia archaeon]|nr:diphthamide synthesis protein [Candidatus Nanoarchaeia archaeon]
MEVLFLDAPFSGTVELSKDTLSYLKKKKYKTVALYASVQFVNNLDQIRKRLAENNIDVITSQADRTHVKGQLLGCDNYHHSLNLSKDDSTAVDCYLYIGDGKFHPLALVYAQKDMQEMREIVCSDPLTKKMTLMGVADIKKILLKYRASLMKYLTAKTVGVIVTIKPGQEQFRPSLVLEKRYANKKFYYFIDNVVSFDQLENFNFIEVWVNTTCPRVGFDDQEKFTKGVINLNDALMAEDILGRDSVLTRL